MRSRLSYFSLWSAAQRLHRVLACQVRSSSDAHAVRLTADIRVAVVVNQDERYVGRLLRRHRWEHQPGKQQGEQHGHLQLHLDEGRMRRRAILEYYKPGCHRISRHYLQNS